MAYDPFVVVNPIVSNLEQHRGRIEQVRENTARQAYSFAALNTHGQGEILYPTIVPFNCTFIELPKVSTGFSMDGDLLIRGLYPVVSAGVWKWQQDRRGFYLGAYVFFTISGDDGYDLTHNFTFSGIALKDLPEYLLEH